MVLKRRKPARKANSTVSRTVKTSANLSAGLAHDLNNLLTVVIASNALLADSLRGDNRALAKAGLAAARTAAQLLHLSLHQGRKPQPGLFDVNAALGELLQLVPHAIGQSVSIETQMAPQPLPVRADRAQLLSAVLNLVLNARHAMPDGGQLRIATALQGNQVSIEIADTGPGLSKTAQAGLGRRGFTTKTSGNGLGLSQVRQFMRQSNGQLRLANKPGGGMIASLHLPHASEKR